VLEQLRLIARVRELVGEDPELAAALTYGSFTQGVGDEWSDIEFWLFPAAGAPFDPVLWCSRVGALNLVTPNEFGGYVAFLPGLLRMEVHVAEDVSVVRDWPARGAPVDDMVLLDRTGELTRALGQLRGHPPVPDSAAQVEALCGRFANWLVLADHVLRRGEVLRAFDALGHVQRHLLWLVRLSSGHVEHWLTPSRAAETDLPAHQIEHLASATGAARTAQMHAALRNAWAVGRVHWTELAARYNFPVPDRLFTELDAALPE
jgi:lincosamide nucleotidyltransferase B/F